MNRYILVTGALGGMGRAVTELLMREGYSVIALDRKAGESGKNFFPIEADVTSEDSILAAYKKIKDITTELYAILHFAGVYMLDSLVEIETSSFDKIFDINLRGVYLVNKIFMPLLKKDSRILITTSELSPLDPLPFTGIYALTKSALDKYAYSLRMELQLFDIKVSVLRAGAVDTDMIDVSTNALDRFIDKTKYYKCNAERFKRIVGRVEARKIKPNKIAKKAFCIINKRNPSFSYSINRNPLLLLMNMLPQRIQFFVIRQILK